jgi:hypothetical protein
MATTSIIDRLQDYMFTSTNLNRLTAKHIIHKTPTLEATAIPMVSLTPPITPHLKPPMVSVPKVIASLKQQTEKYYPKQKDSLFWCFYILKHGYFKYEMEISNNYFVVEKTEKYKYIELLRKNKDILKIHKIKPFTLLEDDLANKDKISIKTFFALCVLEKMNILLVDNHKYFELLSDDDSPLHVIHKNRQTLNHYIEVNTNTEIINKYKQTYYKLDCLDSKLKAIGSYKLDELVDLCNKLDINININNSQKKHTKADIYNLLVLHY